MNRLNKCVSVSYDLNNPILLPKTSHLTELFVIDFHESCKHLGLGTTLCTGRNQAYDYKVANRGHL